MSTVKLFGTFVFIFNLVFAYGQGFKVSGSIQDSTDKSALPAVIVQLKSTIDSIKPLNTQTDTAGLFVFDKVPSGKYTLVATYIGYAELAKRVIIRDQDVNVGALVLDQGKSVLKEVEIQGVAQRVQQLGDTTQYNAAAYKTNANATIEDLVAKMPGITTLNGSVTAQGQKVQQVLLDGKPFFGDDPAIAMKNLSADMVDKIQVFDRLSDQSQFSGFNDGNTIKTLNIVTKNGKDEGQFGKVYAGYGENNRYMAGGNVNFFKKNRRISLLGLTNNINQQNFGLQDIMSAVGSGGSGGRGGGGMGGGGGMRDMYTPANNFISSSQNGINTSHSFGLNYSNEWTKKLKASGSYFFNRNDNNNDARTARNFIFGRQNGLMYNQDNFAFTQNINHRFNARLEYNPDTNQAIIFTPSFSLQNNFNTSNTNGRNFLGNGIVESLIQTRNPGDGQGYDGSANFLYRYKFNKARRSISTNINSGINNKNSNTSLYSLNEFIGSDTSLIDQKSSISNNGLSLGANIMYTEPVRKQGQFFVNYNPSIEKNNNDKNTFNTDPFSDQYTRFDTSLSNVYKNNYTTHRSGLGYRTTYKKLTLMTALSYQFSQLSGDQSFPKLTEVSPEINRKFENILPQSMANIKFNKNTNLRIVYRSYTQAPTIIQLQSIVNNSNPLFLSIGNRDLKQTVQHFFVARFGKVMPGSASNINFVANAGIAQDYVGNSTTIALKDSLMPEGFVLKRGSQLTRQVNLSGNWNASGTFTYGRPIPILKSNMNLSSAITINSSPALINQQLNTADNYNFSEGIVLGSNISQNIDFTLSYTANYSIVKNSLQKQADNNYFYQISAAKFNWVFLKRMVFNTNVSNTLYKGLTGDYNQSYTLASASLGILLLKDKSLEAKITVFDVFKQNNSINRSVTETYIQDTQTQVLTRYAMVVLTYNLRKFSGQKSPDEIKK